MTVREVVLIPYSECDRHWNRVIWATDAVTRLLTENLRNGQAIVKVHGHGCGYTQFSETDDTSDTSLFASVGNFLEDGLSHASIVVMDDGEIFGRRCLRRHSRTAPRIDHGSGRRYPPLHPHRRVR
jgi:hypothetical protein